MLKLYNKDALDLLKEIDSNSIDLIVTDPPYRVGPRGNAGGSGGMFQKKVNMNGKVFTHNDIEFKEYLPEFYRILKDGTHLYLMVNHFNLIEALNVATQCGFHFTKSLIWDKGNKIMGQFYMSQFEYILFFRKGKGKKINNCGTSDIIAVPNKKTKDVDGSNLHDTEKPVELLEILIGNSTQPGELVLDPFMGIGSAGIASKNLERDFIGCELDKKYFEIAKNRITEKPVISNKKEYLTKLFGGES